MREVFKPIIDRSHAPVKIVSVRSAELIKHGANTFLANKISFANLIAEACEAAGADALEVLEAIGLDDRIGKKFLNPGIGYGGSCFPKDIAAFGKTLEGLGVDPVFVSTIESINTRALERFASKIESELQTVRGKTIAVLGLSFKPDTDDIRNAPSIKLISRLLDAGAVIQAYDPEAMENTRQVLPAVTYTSNSYDAARGAHALVICTEWDEFRSLDLNKLKTVMVTPLIFDGRNVIGPLDAKGAGFTYYGVGR
jgi:UDPglucose 6-dehydrogenase